MKRRNLIVNKIVWAGLGLLLAAPWSWARTNHVVERGDSLDSIGRKYGVSAAAIATENKIEKPELIQPGQELIIPAAAPAVGEPTTYEVKSGDTLGSIAIAHGTTVQAISGMNDITDPKTLRAGTVIKIPAASGSPGQPSAALTAEQRNPLPADLKRILDATPVAKSRWKHIVIHHSASAKGSLQSMDMYHRQKRKMENGLAYHFVIGNGQGMPDGKIEIGNRWKRQIKGGHLASDNLNFVSLGICLVGNFDVSSPTEAQMKSLAALTAYLMRRCNIPKSGVQTHRQINTKPTACPGKQFPMNAFLKRI
jgi:LysM repeat protein